MKHYYKTFIFTLLTLFAYRSNAQTYHWSVLTGDSTFNQDFASCITQDGSNNLIACGWFNGFIQLDPASSISFNLHSSNASAFITKYSPSGTFKWAKAITGTSYVSINDVAVDANKNIYVTGTHAGSTDFDPGAGVEILLSLGSSSNMFVAKYDSNGNYQWANTCGSSGNTDAGYTIHIDASNNVLVGGHFTGTAYFDPTFSSASQIQAINSLDAFVAKYDQLGNFQWVKGWDASKCWEVATDATGAVYVFSEFQNTFDANPGTGVFNLTSNGDEDLFLIKLSSTGNFLWAKSVGSASYESAGNLKIKDNALYICGQFSDTMDIDFGPGVSTLQPFNNNNSYIAKYDTSGNLSWAKHIGDSSFVRLEAIDIAANNDVTVVGEYNTFSPSGLDINPGAGSTIVHTNCNINTGLIVRFDANGNFKNGFDIENSARLDLYDIVTDNNENAYVVGFYTDSVFIDPSSSTVSAISEGFEDILIAKYSFDAPTQVTENSISASISIYPNPASDFAMITWKNFNHEPKQIQVFNAVGVLVDSYQIDSNQSMMQKINIANLSSGLYIVQLVGMDGTMSSKKLMIE